ncbi:MAG TPA: hypothetical protein VG963_30690, partial [Polyangiaceae bacterium]|nr:hypothetical protein [Polyangiaceae bacterium]
RMIGHPTARHIGNRPSIDFDLHALLTVAEGTGTALEINGSLERLDLSVELLRHTRGRAVGLVLTSDAHDVAQLGRIEYAVRNAERAWIEPEQVINTWPPERLESWLAMKQPGSG